MTESLCPDCGTPRSDWTKVCPACGAPPEPEQRNPSEGAEGVRAADLEPYITLRYIARLFKVLAVLIIDAGHDIRVARILLGRINAQMHVTGAPVAPAVRGTEKRA